MTRRVPAPGSIARLPQSIFYEENEGDDATLIAALRAEPESATTIFLRIEGLHEGKSLTTRLRKRRRRVAKRLELLAEERRIGREQGVEPPIPLYRALD